MARITYTLTIDYERDDGHPVGATDVEAMKSALHSAIWDRVFSEGFTPDYMTVEDWDARSVCVPPGITTLP